MSGLEGNDPPIQVGGGSILIKLNEKEQPWSEWIKHAPDGHEQEAMSWSWPDPDRQISKIYELGLLASDKPRSVSWAGEVRNGDWPAMLVVRFSDGTIIQIHPQFGNGKGLTITSSRPFGDYEQSTHELRIGGKSGPRIEEAYVCEEGRRRRFPLCRDVAVGRIGILYSTSSYGSVKLTKRKRP